MKLKNKNILCQNVTVLLKEMTIVYKGFPGGSDGKESACNVGDLGSISMLERSPGEGQATHYSILAWRSPWTEEPGRLQSMGLQRVRHDQVTNTHTHKPIYSIIEPSGQAHAEPSINRRSIMLWEVNILSKSKTE